ncbi:hypothetical protein K501DRAFT_287686 [Backusella circina FSU 941]|nr:hypothetical protein K501DRAFT_287686 [Backusella circina FSU 941]
MDVVLQKLIESKQDEEQKNEQYNDLLDLVKAERKEKVELWTLLEERLQEIDKLGRALFKLQGQVIELKNRNEFWKEKKRGR